MYKQVPTSLNFVDREKAVEKFWEDNNIFKKSMEHRKEGEMGCGSGKAVLKRDGAELESIADAEWGEDFNELVLTTSKEYTEDGVYTLEIPEGFFLSGTGDALPAITFTWTVSGGSDGMHSIVITADEDTYSLDGRRMKAYRNGIVIKNGKKTIMMN